MNRNKCRQFPQQNRSSPNIPTAGQPSSSGDGRVDEEMRRVCQKIDKRDYRYKMDASESF